MVVPSRKTTMPHLDVATPRAPTGGAASRRDERLIEFGHRLYQELIGSFNLKAPRAPGDDGLRSEIRRAAEEMCRLSPEPLTQAEQDRLLREVLDEVFALGRLEPVHRDPTVGDILTNGPRTTTDGQALRNAAPGPVVAASPPRGKGERRWPRRLIRWGVGLALLTTAAWVGIPLVLHRSSIQATVTAPLVAVRVPQSGVVQGTPPAVGDAVCAGQSLFTVEPAAVDRRPAKQLQAEIESSRRTADAVAAQIAELEALRGRLLEQGDAYQQARITQAERLAAEQQAVLAAAEARLRTAEYEHELQINLARWHAVPVADLVRAKNYLDAARHDVVAQKQAADRLQEQLVAARRGQFVGAGDGTQDLSPSRQRLDELTMQLAALRARLAELEARLGELTARLASELQHLAGQATTVAAPVAGVVWSSHVVRGNEINPSTVALEIVDTSRLVVEALFSQSHADAVRPGAAVQVRLLGSDEVLTGRIVRVLGASSVEPGTSSQAARVPATAGTFRAVIELDQQPGGGTPGNQFHVGRPAVVWLPR
jgi:multidrug resistance efflux pump